MVKVKKVGGRGTISYEKDEGPAEWAGDTYREVQKKRLEKVGKNITMHMGRGIKTTKLKDLPEPQARPSTYGRTRVTARGTSSRKSRNKGSKKD